MRSPGEARRIALVSMPFASTRRPSLQIGMLKGLAERVGWRADTLHLSLDFAALIGRDAYEVLCQHRGMQLSDWIFSVAAFGADAPDAKGDMLASLPLEYRDALTVFAPEGDVDRWLLRIRDALVPAYIGATRDVLIAVGYDVIAFTSTFQQNVASFALAASIKASNCDATLLFGGANFDDVMGVEFVRSMPFIDYAAIGEGDESFPEFLRRFANGEDVGDVPGIASRDENGGVRYRALRSPFMGLDDSPLPDYDEYFARFDRLGFQGDDPRRQIDLPVEGSRGCWWGAKSHCIFCGLNAGTMKYRAKSPARMLSEISWLSARHRSFHIEAVDNIIDMRLFESVLPELGANQHSWNIFFEVKSNLRPAQVAALAAAGVKRIQPGIESLSTPVLKLMRKGVTGIQNVNLLRWCAYHGIRASWNLLWGFPGETLSYYEDQIRLFPHLKHLQPPDGQGRIWMERFSPLFTQANAMGVTRLEPSVSYQSVYPDRVDLAKAAYFFDYEIKDALPDEAYQPLVSTLDAWRAAVHGPTRPTLEAFRTPGYIRIEDARNTGSAGMFELEGPLAAIYDAFFEAPAGIGVKAKAIGMEEAAVAAIVDDFAAQGLMMRDGNLALALALPARAAT